MELTVDQIDPFTDVDAASGFVPEHVTGQVRAGQKDHPPIALAMAVYNGEARWTAAREVK